MTVKYNRAFDGWIEPGVMIDMLEWNLAQERCVASGFCIRREIPVAVARASTREDLRCI